MLGRVTIPGQPELEAAMNKMVEAINRVSAPAITGGPGIRITQGADGAFVIENTYPPETRTRPFYPRIFKSGDAQVVSITPGFVVYPRRGPTFNQNDNEIDEDDEADDPGEPSDPEGQGSWSGCSNSYEVMPVITEEQIPVDDEDPPGEELEAGPYRTWLIIGPKRVLVQFKPYTEPPQDVPFGSYALCINSFLLSEAASEDMGLVMSNVKIFVERPIAEWDEQRDYFSVLKKSDPVMEGETVTAKAKVTVAGGMLYVQYIAADTSSSAPRPLYTMREVPVEEHTLALEVEHNDYVYLKVEYTRGMYYNTQLKLFQAGGDGPAEGTPSLASMRVYHSSVRYDNVQGVPEGVEDPEETPGAYSVHAYLSPPEPAGWWESYIKVALIKIINNKVVVYQKLRGALVCPAITLPFGNNADDDYDEVLDGGFLENEDGIVESTGEVPEE